MKGLDICESSPLLQPEAKLSKTCCAVAVFVISLIVRDTAVMDIPLFGIINAHQLILVAIVWLTL